MFFSRCALRSSADVNDGGSSLTSMVRVVCVARFSLTVAPFLGNTLTHLPSLSPFAVRRVLSESRSRYASGSKCKSAAVIGLRRRNSHLPTSPIAFSSERGLLPSMHVCVRVLFSVDRMSAINASRFYEAGTSRARAHSVRPRRSVHASRRRLQRRPSRASADDAPVNCSVDATRGTRTTEPLTPPEQ